MYHNYFLVGVVLSTVAAGAMAVMDNAKATAATMINATVGVFGKIMR